MKRIICLPGGAVAGVDFKKETQEQGEGFGFFQTLGKRPYQEDALAYQVLGPDQWVPEGQVQPLSPVKIVTRLWSAHLKLDNNPFQAKPGKHAGPGTTASSTVYDGQGAFITATVGDSSAFVAILIEGMDTVAVMRLNSTLHNTDNFFETMRIESSGGYIHKGRVNGILIPTRSIGNRGLKSAGVSAHSSMDVYTIEQILDELDLGGKEFKFNALLISVSDGFTDGCCINNHAAHVMATFSIETYLSSKLQSILSANSSLMGSDDFESTVARQLAEAAIADGSKDNITVAVRTVDLSTEAFFLGIYDGHGGLEASSYAAASAIDVFTSFCVMPDEVYVEDECSVFKKTNEFQADNAGLMGRLPSPRAYSTSTLTQAGLSEASPKDQQNSYGFFSGLGATPAVEVEEKSSIVLSIDF